MSASGQKLTRRLLSTLSGLSPTSDIATEIAVPVVGYRSWIPFPGHEYVNRGRGQAMSVDLLGAGAQALDTVERLPFEKALHLLHVERLFFERVGIPLAALGSEEVATIDVNRSSDPLRWIDHGVNDIGSEHLHIPGR